MLFCWYFASSQTCVKVWVSFMRLSLSSLPCLSQPNLSEMSFFINFFSGYKVTPRQECKSRAVVADPANASQDEWKEEGSDNEVPSVSFSLGNAPEEDPSPAVDAASPTGAFLGNGYEYNLFQKNIDTTSSDSGASSAQRDVKRNDDSKPDVDDSKRLSQSTSRKVSLEQSGVQLSQSEEVAHKDGDIEWMYQLNTLAKQHAKRSKHHHAPTAIVQGSGGDEGNANLPPPSKSSPSKSSPKS